MHMPFSASAAGQHAGPQTGPAALLPLLPVCCAGASVKVFALDAAQPFDFEHRMQNKISKDKQLKIGIVGFGTFGQFLARRMVEAGHRCVEPQAWHRPVQQRNLSCSVVLRMSCKAVLRTGHTLVSLRLCAAVAGTLGPTAGRMRTSVFLLEQEVSSARQLAPGSKAAAMTTQAEVD
jgi:hypothetical protein